MNPKLKLMLGGRPHISVSQLDTYTSCSLKYFYSYIGRAEPERESVHLIFGNAFHTALTIYYTALKNREPVAIEETCQAFQSYLEAEFKRCEKGGLPIPLPKQRNGELETPAALIEKGRAMVAAYVRATALEPEEIVAIEEPFMVWLSDDHGTFELPLVGEFDIVLRDSRGEMLVVDWKTSGRAYSAAEVESKIQSVAYQYAAFHHFGDADPRFRFDVTTKTNEPKVERYFPKFTPDKYARLAKKVRTMRRMVKAGLYLPVDDPQICAGCAYPARCADWQRS